jgi:single-strand DNA-binding protein
MNQVILTGRITKEIDVKYTASQMAVARFSLALDRGKDKDGKDKGADFPNCIAFGKTAEALERFSGKGLRVTVIGHLQTGSYEKSDGQKVYTTDVIVDRIEIIDWNNNATQGRVAIEPNDFAAVDEDIPF